MKCKSSPISIFAAICLLLLISIGSRPARAQQATETVLYGGFSSATGEFPYDYGSLVMDASGNIFGTAYEGGDSNNGMVFELVNSSGSYSEKILYSFTGSGGDGTNPAAGLITDPSGNLYGTTYLGGANNAGTVFELVNSFGTYSEQVLHSFGGYGDGSNPQASLLMDASGNLYGTTTGGCAVGINSCGGTVFELVNSSGTYTEKVLYSFTGSQFSGQGDGDGALPVAGLIMDASGNLYGTTLFGGNLACNMSDSSCGTVFELVNSSGTYTEKVLYSFTGVGGDSAQPYASLIMDSSGNLYGTTRYGGNLSGGNIGNGTVFELVNSSGTYSEMVLYGFNVSAGDGFYPYAGLTIDSSGNLYGATSSGGIGGGGTVFELVNSSGSYTERILYSFTNSGGDGETPYSGLTMDMSGNLYGTTLFGGMSSQGTAFEITDATTVSVSSGSNPSAYRQPVTFTATISDLFGNVKQSTTRKAVQPQVVTGMVTWSTNTGCGTTPMTSGTARCTTSILSVGDDVVTVSYSGNHNPASGSINQTVNQAPTTASVTSNVEPAAVNQSVTYTATVSASYGGALTGTVTLKDGTKTVSTFAVGSATFTTSYATTGTHFINAIYSGDSNNLGSTSSVYKQYIESLPVASITKVTTSGSPSVVQSPVTIRATVTSTFGAIPDGEMVTFYDAATQIGTGTTSGGMATFMTSALSVATHTVKATYAGDATFKTSSGAVRQVVAGFTTSTALSTSPSPSAYGQSVMLTAAVTTAGSATPTGKVTFYSNGTLLGIGVLNSTGTATLSTTKLAVGTDSLIASYGGDSLNAKNTSSAVMQTVNPVQITMMLTSSPNPSNSGQSVKLTATLSSDGGLPNGQTVTFSFTSTTLGTTTISGGKANVSTTMLPVGSDVVTATYVGDANHSSASASATQMVN